MDTNTTHLKKVGNAYATADLRYYVKRDAAGYRLHDRDSRCWWHLGRKKAKALEIAEQRLADLYSSVGGISLGDIAKAVAPATEIADPADALPWDRTLDLAAAGLWHRDADACCCSVCGKDVPSQKNGVCLVGGGAIACRPEDYAEFERVDGGSCLGVYPVGSECIKKIPAEYRYSF